MYNINKSLATLEANLNKAISIKDYNQEEIIKNLFANELKYSQLQLEQIQNCKDLFKFLTQ